MAISLTIRGNNTGLSSSGTDATVRVLGIQPSYGALGSERVFLGGGGRNRKGARRAYRVVALPFSVEAATNSNLPQDQGDLDALEDVLHLYRYLWIYSVSGASRVTTGDADWWAAENLPVAITLAGDPRAAANFDGGSVSYEFDIKRAAITLS